MKTADILSNPLTVKVTYHTNYNGCDVEASDTNNSYEDARCSEAAEEIVDTFGVDCDEDGVWDGIPNTARKQVETIIHRIFGHNAVVVVEFDNIST